MDRHSQTPKANALITSVLLSLAGLPLAGCGNHAPTNIASTAQASADAPLRVKTVVVQRRDVDRTIEMPASIEGYETADLYAKVGGYLDEIHVDIGDIVRDGQQLAHLRVPEMVQQVEQKEALVGQALAKVKQAQAGIRQAEADLASARADLEQLQAQRAALDANLELRQSEHDMYEQLHRQNSVQRSVFLQKKFQLEAAHAEMQAFSSRVRAAEAHLAAAEAQREKAQADVTAFNAYVLVAQKDHEHAKTMLQYATITAPFNGEITRRHVHRGAFIQPAEGNSSAKPIFTLTRTDKVRVVLDVPQAEVRLLRRGQKVSIVPENALPGERFPATVSRFSAALNAESRMNRVEIDLDNPGGRLRPGYYATVKLMLQETDVPVVPVSAVASTGDTSYVFVVDDQNVCHRREVIVSHEDGAGRIMSIAQGLQGGERIVLGTVQQPQDGQTVVTEPDDQKGEVIGPEN